MVELNLSLDEAQSEIVGRPADSRTIVLGGPGTGKTHTLVARVKALHPTQKTTERFSSLVSHARS